MVPMYIAAIGALMLASAIWRFRPARVEFIPENGGGAWGRLRKT
ncbi:hypothetical protein [Mesorhizobium sp. M7A.F.Ca.US.011.01.1.1]|nr:hypothetical protein [Mesorhizobium sp. M7A.F.Ca.US.011.01.1.1]